MPVAPTLNPFPPAPTRAEYVEHRRAARVADALPPRLMVLQRSVRPAGLAAGVTVAVGIAAAIAGYEAMTLTLVAALIAAAVALALAYRHEMNTLLDARLRSARAAASQGFGHVDGGDYRFPGFLFTRGGEDRMIVDRVVAAAGRDIEAGNYRYTERVGTGDNRRTVEIWWNYVAIRLDAPLPHFVLDSTRNDGGGGSLRGAIAGAQRLGLEGDFDRHFRVYAPEGYETAALYVLTPDLMAMLIDHAGEYDIELIDDWAILSRYGRVDFAEPRFWEQFVALTRSVGERLVDRGRRYRDERVAQNPRPTEIRHVTGLEPTTGAQLPAEPASTNRPAPTDERPLTPTIAPEGRRLKERKLSDGALLAVIVVGFIAWVVISGFL